WLYDLENQAETDPETPPFYYTPGPLSPPYPAASSSRPMDEDTARELDLYHLSTMKNQTPPQVDHTAAIADLERKIETLRNDFHRFMDLVIEQFDKCSKEFSDIRTTFTAPRG
ncbi:hypothetical protein A2U01_0042700, partial [Trifolium medium]|nr:hypothetical protein [Trifolium medium]